MNVCNLKEMNEYIIKMGYHYTRNVFFVEDVLHWELLNNELHIVKNPGGSITHRSVQSSVYLTWNYKTGIRGEEDVTTFYTQLTLFKFFKETHEDYMDSLIGELLDYNLTSIALESEHMF